MKKFNRLFLIGCLPAIALFSCQKNSKISFNDASTYVCNNYDANTLDNVDALYSFKINKISLDLNVVVTSGSSESEFAITLEPLSGLKFQCNLPVVTFNTSVLGYTKAFYNQLSQASLEFISDVGTDLNYYLDNGCLTMAVESSSEGKFASVVGSVLSVMNIVYYSSYLPKIGDIVKSMLLGRLPEVVQKIVLMGIGLGADSTGEGSFSTGIKTNNKGYINDIFFKSSAKNLKLNLSSNSFTKLAQKARESGASIETLQYILPQYNYYVTGGLEFDFEISNNA